MKLIDISEWFFFIGLSLCAAGLLLVLIGFILVMFDL